MNLVDITIDLTPLETALKQFTNKSSIIKIMQRFQQIPKMKMKMYTNDPVYVYVCLEYNGRQFEQTFKEDGTIVGNALGYISEIIESIK